MRSYNKLNNEKKYFVRQMFNSIHKTYDFLNHFLSFGIDIYWRKKSLKNIFLRENAICLDLACGTGDYGIEVYKKFNCKIIGYDLAENSLYVFRDKIKKKNLDESKFLLINGEAENLGIKNESIDLITIAFGIRNFYDSQKSLIEMYRVLKSCGILIILEFGIPKIRFIREIYLFYFEKLLPFIGKLISKNSSAYKYLPSSVNLFEKEKDLVGEMIKAGFREVKIESYTFGIVKKYEAHKSIDS